MPRAWSKLPEVEQLALANTALSHAVDVFLENAELLAIEFDQGVLTDRGGAESLRLLACIIRKANSHKTDRAGLPVTGNA